LVVPSGVKVPGELFQVTAVPESPSVRITTMAEFAAVVVSVVLSVQREASANDAVLPMGDAAVPLITKAIQPQITELTFRVTDKVKV